MSEPNFLVSYTSEGKLSVFLNHSLVTEEVGEVRITRTSGSIVLADGRELLAWERDVPMSSQAVVEAQAEVARFFGLEGDESADEPLSREGPRAEASELTGVDRDVYDFLTRPGPSR
jgi:hypothetical protein